MIGAEPRTGWLDGRVQRDGQGFVLTGRDLDRAAQPGLRLAARPPAAAAGDQHARGSAAGDVRHRSIKRVASAVGEGATAIQLVHEYLQAAGQR